MLPFALFFTGLLVDGDVMRFAGELGLISLPSGILAVILGYVLRYILDKSTETHKLLNVYQPIIVAFLVAAVGSGIHYYFD